MQSMWFTGTRRARTPTLSARERARDLHAKISNAEYFLTPQTPNYPSYPNRKAPCPAARTSDQPTRCSSNLVTRVFFAVYESIAASDIVISLLPLRTSPVSLNPVILPHGKGSVDVKHEMLITRNLVLTNPFSAGISRIPAPSPS